MYERVFLLEASGLTLDLIRSEREALPHLGRFIERGASAALRGFLQPTVPVAFGALSTGKNPGRQGLYDYFLFPAGGYEQVPHSAERLREETFYARLSSAGKTIGLLNVPLTWPIPELRGFVVTGDEGAGKEYATPRDALEELERLEYAVPFDASYAPGREREFLDHSSAVLRMRGRALERLFGERPWDFGMLSLNAVGEILHAFWRFRDPSHPDFRPPGELFGGLDPVREILRAVDGLVGRAVELAGPRGLVLVASAWGHRLEHSRVQLNAFLARRGYLSFRGSLRTRIKRALYRLGVTAATAERLAHRLNLYRLFHYKLGRGARSAIKGKTFLSYHDIDWARTRAVAVGSFGQIYLNVRGERPSGIVAPEDRERERAALAELLRDLQDPRTGGRVVERVLSREEVYSGPHTGDAPDLLVELAEGYSGDGGFSGGGRLVVKSPPNHSSDHCPTGVLLALGDGVRPGEGEAGLIDVAPTVLRALGVEVPCDYEGRALSILPA